MLEGLPITLVDIAVVGILGISGLLAYFRGFAKEVLGIFSWLGAILITVYGYKYALPYAEQLTTITLVSTVGTVLVLFFTSLIVLGFITSFISGRVKESAVGALDRALGFAYGIVRGGLLICLIFLGLSWIWGEEPLPEAFEQARTLPVIRQVTQEMIALAPEHLQEQANSLSHTKNTQPSETEKLKENFERLAQPEPKQKKGQDETSYTDKDRSELDALIENSQ